MQTSAEVKTSRFLSGFAQFVVHALRDVIERIGDVVALSVDFPLDAGNVAAQSLLPGLEAVKAIRPTIFYPYHYGEVEEKTDIDRLARELEGVTEVRIRPME